MSDPVPGSEEDRGVGLLLGLAAGDRNGGPLGLARALGRSLVERRVFDIDDVKRRYRAWWRTDGVDSGPVFAAVLARVEGGEDWASAAEAVDHGLGGMTGGCNPAHRAAPLALAPIATEGLEDAVRRNAALTHRAEVAGTVAAYVVLLCRRLIEGAAWSDASAEAGRLAEAPALRVPAAPRNLSRGGYAPDSLAAALRFLEDGGSFGDALETAVAFAGLANYCPVLVGAIGGARWGASAIPNRNVAHVADPAEVRREARQLARRSGR